MRRDEAGWGGEIAGTRGTRPFGHAGVTRRVAFRAHTVTLGTGRIGFRASGRLDLTLLRTKMNERYAASLASGLTVKIGHIYIQKGWHFPEELFSFSSTKFNNHALKSFYFPGIIAKIMCVPISAIKIRADVR